MIKDLIGKDESFECGNKIENSIIIEVENRLKLKLPKEYKSFLMECGYISFGDSFLYGIFDIISNERGSMFGETLYARNEYGLGDNYIVIESIEDENIYTIKTSEIENEDSQVYSFDINSNNKLSKPQIVSDSFKEHYKDFVESLKD
jgi:hypothetical protein